MQHTLPLTAAGQTVTQIDPDAYVVSQDDDKKRPATNKIKAAIQAYLGRYDTETMPLIVMVNAALADLAAAGPIDGVTLVVNPIVRPNQFWVGNKNYTRQTTR